MDNVGCFLNFYFIETLFVEAVSKGSCNLKSFDSILLKSHFHHMSDVTFLEKT